MIPRIFIATSDKTQFILELFCKLWKKRVDFPCTVLGYNFPPVPLNLPANFEFISIANRQQSTTEWAKHLRHYFETIKDEYVIFTLDDYLPRRWNQENFDKGFEIMQNDKNIVRYELDRFSKFSTDPPSGFRDEEGFKYLNRNAPYRVSCQPSVWRVDWLLLCLDDGYTPHLFEVKGSKARTNDGKDVICSNNKPALEYGGQSCWSGNPDKVPWAGKLNITGTHHEDLPDLLEFADKYDLQIHPSVT